MDDDKLIILTEIEEKLGLSNLDTSHDINHVNLIIMNKIIDRVIVLENSLPKLPKKV